MEWTAQIQLCFISHLAIFGSNIVDMLASRVCTPSVTVKLASNLPSNEFESTYKHSFHYAPDLVCREGFYGPKTPVKSLVIMDVFRVGKPSETRDVGKPLFSRRSSLVQKQNYEPISIETYDPLRIYLFTWIIISSLFSSLFFTSIIHFARKYSFFTPIIFHFRHFFTPTQKTVFTSPENIHFSLTFSFPHFSLHAENGIHPKGACIPSWRVRHRSGPCSLPHLRV